MELPDYYALLDINPNADLETIKKAFRKKIAIYHPENNTSEAAREKFEQLIEAFDVLSNEDKRKDYDAMLSENKSQSLPTTVPENKEETYKEWQREAKKKADKSWASPLEDLLLLELFFELGWLGIFDGFGDSMGDIIGDVFDVF